MREVGAELQVPGTVPEAEACWCDTAHWPRWVDGLAEVTAVDAAWPEAGARVIWESGPAGRGRVVEQVVAREKLRGLALDVSDQTLRGRQTVTFTPSGDGVEVQLRLAYQLARRSIVSPVVDLLFIRRAMTESLQTTLHRFAAELDASRARARA